MLKMLIDTKYLICNFDIECGLFLRYMYNYNSFFVPRIFIQFYSILNYLFLKRFVSDYALVENKCLPYFLPF